MKPTTPGPALLEFDPTCTALVITDPWNQLVNDTGRFRFRPWKLPGLVRKGRNLRTLLQAARASSVPIVISPQVYYPQDHGWSFSARLAHLLRGAGMHTTNGPWILREGGSWYGEDPLETESMKLESCQGGGLVLELARRGIDRILLAGMAAHVWLRGQVDEFREQGFRVGLVQDATALVEAPERPLLIAPPDLPLSARFTTRDIVGLLRRGSVH